MFHSEYIYSESQKIPDNERPCASKFFKFYRYSSVQHYRRDWSILEKEFHFHRAG